MQHFRSGGTQVHGTAFEMLHIILVTAPQEYCHAEKATKRATKMC